jgi:MFS family permease
VTVPAERFGDPPVVAPKRSGAARSLHNRNFRLYLIGQAVSQTGNWFQVTAELWMIVLITNSGTAVGVHSMLRFGPILLFGIPAGLVTDRFDHIRLLGVTQAITGATAVVLAVAAFISTPSLILIYAVVLVRGVVFAVDNPLRRTVVRDLVTDEELTNAVGLNSSANTIARTLGPAISGVLLATVGAAWCFTVNAVSYVPVFVTLAMIDRRSLRPVPPARRARGQVRAGLRYAWSSRRIRRTLIMVALLGIYPLNWQVIVPFYASDTFDGGAGLFGLMTSVTAVGAFAGTMVVARLHTIVGAHFRIVGAVMAASFIVLAVSPQLPLAVAGLALLGASVTSFQVVANGRLQLESDDAMSGRILAIYGVALIGTRPVGGLVTGFVTEHAGPRWAFAISAVVVAIVVATVAFGPQSRARWSDVAFRWRGRPSGP